MAENTEYLPSYQAAERGFTGFCLGEFRDDCIEGPDACLDWERCYKTLSHLDDDRQPKAGRMKDRRVYDLRKAARDAWPCLLCGRRETIGEKLDRVVKPMLKPTITCSWCDFPIPSGTDDYFNSQHTKIFCPECKEVTDVDLSPGPVKLVKVKSNLCACRDPYFVGGVCVKCGFPRVERRKAFGYTIY